MMEAILVTGSEGFIGKRLVEQFRRQGANIKTLDKVGMPDFMVDMADYEKLKTIFEKQKFESIIHLGGNSNNKQSLNRPASDAIDNIISTINLVACANKFDVTHLIYASSYHVYGIVKVMPILEWTCPSPITPLGVSKLAAEHYCKCFKGRTCILRLGYVYGPGQDNVVKKLLTALQSNKDFTVYGDGMQTRDFIHVDDVIEAIKISIGKNYVYNIGTGIGTTMIELITVLAELLDKKPKVMKADENPMDIPNIVLDVKRAKMLLDWEAKIPLKEGLRYLRDEQVKFAQQHPNHA